jgi:hypothetical protein
MTKGLSERPHTYEELVKIVDNLVNAVSYLTIKVRDINIEIKKEK